jgi:hypothetical protein
MPPAEAVEETAPEEALEPTDAAPPPPAAPAPLDLELACVGSVETSLHAIDPLSASARHPAPAKKARAMRAA